MAFADLDFLDKELPVITGAPHLFWGGIIATIIFTVSITWFVVNWGYRQRLRLGDERVKYANDVRDDIIRQFKDFKEEAGAGAGVIALTARIEQLETSFNKLTAADNAVRSAIGIAVRSSFVTDTISNLYSGTPHTLRDQAGARNDDRSQ
jgi:hypothetical protein